ncbi:MAG: hypothetical protein HUJ54_11785 [Erysipelotrichaceae bacterium]|nr:hypothetical protein [Erysipelotrichaceae bacterium]
MKKMYRKAAAGFLAAGMLLSSFTPLLAAQSVQIKYADGYMYDAESKVDKYRLVKDKMYIVIFHSDTDTISGSIRSYSEAKAYIVKDAWEQEVLHFWSSRKVTLADPVTGDKFDMYCLDCDFYEIL